MWKQTEEDEHWFGPEKGQLPIQIDLGFRKVRVDLIRIRVLER